MSNQLMTIKSALTNEKSMAKMAMAAGFDAMNQTGRARAMQCASSVFAEIEKTAGDKNKDLTLCVPDSLVQCATDSLRCGVPIDGRQLAHIVKYGNKASFQLGYRAYLAKIKEHYPDADFVVEPVYQGDELKIWEENGLQCYSLVRKSVFNDGADKLQGILFAVTYTSGGRLIRRVNAVPKARIERARKAAKQDYVWSSDYIEKAKAAAIKASCKIMFAAIQGLQDMIRYDNETHYDVEKGVLREETEVKASSIIDNINRKVSGGDELPMIEAETVEPEILDADHEVIGEENDLSMMIVDAKDENDLRAAHERLREEWPTMDKDTQHNMKNLFAFHKKRIQDAQAAQSDSLDYESAGDPEPLPPAQDDIFPGDRP